MNGMVHRYSLAMSRLVPEVRVNKNGVPVVKHVRPDGQGSAVSSLSSVAPVLSQGERVLLGDEAQTRRSEIGRELRDHLRAYFDDHERLLKQRIAKGSPAESSSASKRLAEAVGRRGKLERSISNSFAFGRFRSYSLETMEQFVRVVSSDDRSILDLLISSPEEERELLVFLNFPDEYMGRRLASKVYGDVGRAVGIGDLSRVVPGSEEHALVSSVLRVASEANKNRMSVFPRDEREDRSTENDQAQMTRELAAVIMEHPSRVEDIIGFLRERKVHPSVLECEGLREYLRAPRAVSVGSL